MKKQKGITLIALVITIIVLIILAGVTISALLGDDGIVVQAEIAEEGTNREGEIEQIEMAYNALYMKKKPYKKDSEPIEEGDLEEQFINNGSKVSDVKTTEYGFEIIFASGGKYSLNVDNKEVKSLNEENESSGGGNSATLASQITSVNYGDYVNYPVDLGITSEGVALSGGEKTKTDWRIFYKDEDENVFLIASDYLPADKFPTEVFSKTDGKYSGTWSAYSSGTLVKPGTVTSNTRFLFSKLSNINKTNFNYQIVETLLDTTKWTAFAKTGFVDDTQMAVIGTPTVEMWMASWNEKYTDILTCDANTIGYTVGMINKDLSDDIDLQAKVGYKNTLYFPHFGSVWNTCAGYLLAAPAACNVDGGLDVGYNGCVGYLDNDLGTFGLRPVVAMKLGIIATKNSNGVWELIEQ